MTNEIWICKAVGMHEGREFGHQVGFTKDEMLDHNRAVYLEEWVRAAFRGRYRVDPAELYWELASPDIDWELQEETS